MELYKKSQKYFTWPGITVSTWVINSSLQGQKKKVLLGLNVPSKSAFTVSPTSPSFVGLRSPNIIVFVSEKNWGSSQFSVLKNSCVSMSKNVASPKLKKSFGSIEWHDGIQNNKRGIFGIFCEKIVVDRVLIFFLFLIYILRYISNIFWTTHSFANGAWKWGTFCMVCKFLAVQMVWNKKIKIRLKEDIITYKTYYEAKVLKNAHLARYLLKKTQIFTNFLTENQL